MRRNLLHLAQRLANLPKEVKEDLKDPNCRGGTSAGLSVGSPLSTMKARMSDAGSSKRSTQPTRKSKRSTQPTRKSNRKKHAQTTLRTSHSSQNHIPLTIPSDVLQADTNQNQTTQFESIQSHPQPQSSLPQPTQPQPIPLKRKKYARTALGTSHSSQNCIPLTIPSDVLQANTNHTQTTQFESTQPQPIQPRPIPLKQKYARTALGTSHSSQNLIPLTIPSEALQAVLQALTNQIQTTQLESVQPQPQSTLPQPTQLQPIPLTRKRYARKKSSRTRTPLTIPSDVTLQANTNQTHITQFETIQPQHTPPEPTQPQLIPTQIPHMQEFPMVNHSPSASCHVSGGDNGNKIMILPEGDGFDKHKLVIGTIASCIRSKFEEAQPSWKKFSQEQRDIWFDIFKSKFTWPPEYDDIVRRNFEKRGSAKMIQLMQDVRKNLNKKPNWIREPVWTQLKAQWESSSFKEKSEINKRNRDAMAGASLHTGGSVPHHLHWKRMKEEKGTDPSFSEFYFRTHRKKDHSWVGPCAKYAYDKYVQRKFELFSQNSTFVLGDDNVVSSQQSKDMPADIDIWVDSVGGKNKRKIFGLGSMSKTFVKSSSVLSANPEDIDAMRKEVQALNDLLQKQEHEKLEMRKELSETKKQLVALMQYLGFVGSSHPSSSSSQRSNEDDDDDNDDDYIE